MYNNTEHGAGSKKEVATFNKWKQWQKPTVITINQKELAAHIKAAARSFCEEGHGRSFFGYGGYGGYGKNTAAKYK